MRKKLLIEIDHDKCTLDEFCLVSCPMGIFQNVDGKIVPMHTEKCILCRSCLSTCMNGAISVKEVDD